MSRAERLLTLMEILRRHRAPASGAVLARELGVSLRTLYRDIASLQGQGAPIEGAAGLGYVLKPGFWLPPLMFSEKEIEAIALGSRWVAKNGDEELARAARSAFAKIAAALPAALRDEAESSVFPIPPDVILAPMSLAEPKKAWRFAVIATVAAVSGGMLGYAIGALLYDTVGRWLIHLYGYADKAAALKETYARWGALVIVFKGVAPIPFKLVTIVSGLLGYNFPLFVALSLITRGGRFFLLAAALNHFGDPLRIALERHFAVFLASMTTIVVVGFFLAAHVM